MTYYEAESGARVFAAGAFSIAGQIGEAHVSRVVSTSGGSWTPPS
jgi:hypothetical protein